MWIIWTQSNSKHITAAIKNSVDFDWIRSSGCSLHYQGLVDGIASSVTSIYMKKSVYDGNSSAEGNKEKVNIRLDQ
jgi:hypothetical protein